MTFSGALRTLRIRLFPSAAAAIDPRFLSDEEKMELAGVVKRKRGYLA